jgi:hypothetical protein
MFANLTTVGLLLLCRRQLLRVGKSFDFSFVRTLFLSQLFSLSLFPRIFCFFVWWGLGFFFFCFGKLDAFFWKILAGLGLFLGLQKVLHQGWFFGKLFSGNRPLLRDYRRGFDITFLYGFFFRLKNRFDCYLHKILEAVPNELSMINNLEEVTYENLLGANVLVLAGVGDASVILVTAGEYRANRCGERNGQHQVVRAH